MPLESGMARCRGCGSKPLPIVRKGLPTIFAYGPFPNHEEVDYTEIDQHGTVQEDDEAPNP